MLLSLKIENIAIIESADIEFDSGLNVLTGETGAGKSIIIDSINAVLGERTSRELIRTGASSARVTALFSDASGSVCGRLAEFDIFPDEDGNILLQRTLSADGKNSCRINGVPATVSVLRQVGHELINIHGQHDNQALLSPEKHFTFIDSIADNSTLLSEYREKFALLCSYIKERESLNTDEAEKLRQLDLLDFQIDELEQADIKPGEREELVSRKDLLQNCEKIISSLRAAYDILSGGEDGFGAVSAVGDAAGLAEDAAEYYKQVAPVAQAMRSAGYELEECADEVRRALDDFGYDPSELNSIEERLDELFRLSVKYGATEEDMLEFLSDARERREKIILSDERLKQLDSLVDSTKTQVRALAQRLTESREKAARLFEKSVMEQLEFLDMPNVRFSVERTKTAFTVNGADGIEFLISANAGETPKPLAKIASGGELSRVMLAIKSVLADKDELDTMIFDEIDVGVSGRAAQKVAMKLREVSKGRQVICVTHLSQIAAMADCHMRISKSVRDGKTYTEVERLDIEGRKRELARITGGLNVTELQLRNAEEMLRSAGVLK